MLKIAIVGNCQSTSLFHYFERSEYVHVNALLDVNYQGTESFENAKNKLLNECHLIDFVISQPIGDSFGEISSSNLKNIYKDRFLSLTNIYFTGLHPDLSYFGNFGTRVQSPLGDYHSKLALTAFAKQMSVQECLQLYNFDIYNKMGYLDSFKNSKYELLSRDESNDIKFAHRFFEITQQQISLYAVNHPTKQVIWELGAAISRKLGIPVLDGYGFFIDSLVSSSIWPIYPEVAEFHGLPYGTPAYKFYPNINSGNRTLSLDEFVQLSFEEYNKVGYSRFMDIELAQVLKNISL